MPRVLSLLITYVMENKVVLLLLLCFLQAIAITYCLNLLHRDPLTQVLNRRGFFTLAPTVTSRNTYSVLAIDLDFFKPINDRYGHETGDRILREVAGKIRSAIRQHLAPNAVVARFGGEEFVALLPTDQRTAVRVANCIRKLVAACDFGIERRVTLSIGVAEHRLGETLDDVLRRADAAAYQAKKEGRNRVCRWDEHALPPSGRARLRTSERPPARRGARLLRALGRTSRTLWRLSPHQLLLPPLGVVLGNLRTAPRIRRPARRILRTLRRVRSAALTVFRPRKKDNPPRDDRRP